MNFVAGAGRGRPVRLPAMAGDRVGAGAEARVIDAFADSPEVPASGFERVSPAAAGRPAHGPRDMLRPCVHGRLNGPRPSRRLGRGRRTNLEPPWLPRKRAPGLKTVAGFRRDAAAGPACSARRSPPSTAPRCAPRPAAGGS